MPARRPAQARRIELPSQVVRAEPSAEIVAERNARRRAAVLSGGPMRLVADAVSELDGPLEIETDTHIITITAVEK